MILHYNDNLIINVRVRVWGFRELNVGNVGKLN